MFLAFQRSRIFRPVTAKVIRPEDAGLPDGQVHPLRVTAQDGLTLNGWHVLPTGRGARTPDDCRKELGCGRPVILYFPGNSHNRVFRNRELRVLVDLGADIFLFDHRGYGDNPGQPSEEAIAADARAIWRAAVTEWNIAPNRLVIYGESLGGGIAVRLAAELCELGVEPAGLILRSTFHSLVDVAQLQYPYLPVRWVLRDRFASEDRIPFVTCPLLMIHGRNDRVVPFRFGWKLFTAARDHSSSGFSKRFVELSEADHNDVVTVAPEKFTQALRDFPPLRCRDAPAAAYPALLRNLG